MIRLRVLVVRMAGLFGRRGRDRALDEELQAHLDALTDEYIARGMTADAARRAAGRAFGGLERVKEAYRDQRGLPLFDAIAQDVRFAVRLLARRPGFTLAAAGILALGIGVNTTFFTLVNAICIRGLPVERPGNVLFITTLDARGLPSGMSYPDFQDARGHVTRFRALAAYADAPMTIGDDGRAADQVTGTYVSAGTFALLGRRPVLGRELEPGDDRRGGPPVALLSHALWWSRYARNPAIVGRTVNVNGVPTTVVGILAERFRFPVNSDVWLPLAGMPGVADRARDARGLSVIGRVAESSSVDDARAELDALGARLAASYPATNRDTRIRALPINDQFNGRITDAVWIAFMTAGVIVLIVASANAANLFLLRSTARARELAIRTSIGATPGRLVRQLLVECTLFSALGGGLGLLMSVLAVRLLASTVPSGAPLPFWIEFVLDRRVLAVVIAASVMSVFACGLLPGIQSAALRVPRVLCGSGQLGVSNRRTRWWTSGFLALEFGLAFVLVANVALASRSALDWDATRVFDMAPLLTASIALPGPSYPSAAERRAFYDALLGQVHAISGVGSATLSSHLPLGGATRRQLVVGDSQPTPVQVVAADGTYFDTIGLSVVRGRSFTPSDDASRTDDVLVNQRFANVFFPGREILGTRVQLSASGKPEPEAWRTIVGIVPTVRQWSSDDGVPMVYQSFRGESPATAVLIVRVTGGEPSAVAPAVREAVRQLDANLALHRTMSLGTAIHESRWNGRISNAIIITISTIALVLALAGLIVVTAHSITERTREIGLRIAVGAGPFRIVRLVLRRALVQLGAGLALGVAMLVGLGSIFPMPSTEDDARILLAVIVFIALVGLAACVLPALRAARVDPVHALRSE
jgi:predicted permease